jgi:uncharacterized Tic20 family protein
MDKVINNPDELTQNEKLFALFSHFSFFFGGLIVPIVLWAVNGGKSKFVTFHSLQALFFHLAYTILIVCIVGTGAVIGFATGWIRSGMHHGGSPSVPHVIMFAAFGLMIGAVVIISMAYSIYAGISSYKGGLKKYPLIGNLVYNKVYGSK